MHACFHFVKHSGDGYTCTDINECDMGTHKCDVNAGCTNNDGSYTCACNIGYSGIHDCNFKYSESMRFKKTLRKFCPMS